MRLVCIECGRTYSAAENRYACDCGDMLEIVHDYGAMDGEKLKRLFDKRLSERMTLHSGGVWRYKELIAPVLPEPFVTTKYEGNTGLYETEALNRYAGVRSCRFKAQSENPSGSFKDNGMTVAVSYGRSLGYDRFVCSSTGNTSSSLAMYAALAGMTSLVLMPDRNISLNKVLQTLAYGARVVSFPGTYDDGIAFLKQSAEELGLYVCNSINPWRIEGQKSIVYETAQNMGWTLPDWIVVPGGALSNATALGKGLRDLFTLGLIDKLPRVAIVQADGASPFHRMIELGGRNFVPDPAPYTRATAMNIGNPPSWRKALRGTVEYTNGVTVSVSDEDIFNAKALIDRSGIGCEPASAATLAGLRKLTALKIVDSDETAVCILTGNVLKDTDAIRDYHLGDSAEAAYPNRIRQTGLSERELRGLLEEHL
ncbi:threonine synthase [Paenibacillus sp. MBLB4367]|uniref:threonine synthase n=1 Tax=Paenibacillus sp. MBLB4367 TaxID=3384767 RepID=UPI0039082C87